MKLDRMLGILFVLMQKDKVSAPDLARRFEVSRRTISRDVDALCRAGIPIVTRQGAGGGVSIAEGFRIEKGVLTADELSDLLAAVKGVGSVTGGGHAQGLADKLRVTANSVISLWEPVIIDLASHYKGPLTEKIEGIKRAILDRQYVGFDYRYEKGLSHRRIEQDKKGWKPAQPRTRKVTTALKAYALLATSADKGAVRNKALLDG